MKSLRYVSLFFVLTFTLSLSAQTYIGKQKEIDIILQNIKNFSKYLVNGETEKLIACYSEDAQIFPSDKEILSGEALKKYWDLDPKSDYRVTYHKITPVEIKVVKKTAYDYGYYEGTTTGPDGEEFHWKGKYVIVWKKVGKEWKIYLDCWNRIDTGETK